MRCTLTIAITSCLVASSSPAVAQVQEAAVRKQATATRTAAGSIRLDGLLDEEIWLRAVPVTDFIQKEPVEGAPPTDRMDVRIIYDDDALYVGARMYAANPASVQAPLGRRDNGTQAEHILVELDTYLDRRTAYAFGVTASGVRLDHYHPNDSEREADNDFEPVWEARARIDSEGWTAEMWIPFSQLRFNRRDEQLWGLNIHRWVASRNEAVYWVPIPRTAQGWSSRFGELRGIDAVTPRRRMEIVPYVASSATLTGDRDRRNPFDNGTNLDGRVGADIKVGFGSNLTLDATVNPDFGQVEADPAEVNLSAFETFFSERRPFFLEGSRLFQGRGATYFYSRRIGAAPAGVASGDFVDYPNTSAILGAAKLTGRLRSGTSIGMLGAVTGDAEAKTFSLATQSVRRVGVAPMTTFGVARVQQEFGPAASTAGVMVTALHRNVDEGDPLSLLFMRNAITVSGDTTLRLRGGDYLVGAHGGLSYIEGSAQAMDRVQRSSVRYFQRPDNDYVRYDPTRTTMVGGIAGVSVEKIAGRHWLWFANTSVETPEFEINDMGRLGTSDGIAAFANIRYRETEPGRYLRNYTFYLEQYHEWNYGWDRQVGNLYGHVEVTWLNFWTSRAAAWVNGRTQDARLTRGGPLMERPMRMGTSFDVGGSQTAQRRGNVRVQYTRVEDGGLNFNVNGGVSLRPSPQWQLTVNPSYTRDVDTQQYITSAEGGTPLTFGRHYVFAHIDRSTYSTQLRLNYTLRPDVNLDVYAEPFASSGRYSHFGELVAAGTRAMRDTAVPVGNRDFNIQSFRSNVVLRWEWRPGSTLYLVWQQDRSGLEPIGSRATLGDMFGSLNATGDNLLAVKASFWVGNR